MFEGLMGLVLIVAAMLFGTLFLGVGWLLRGAVGDAKRAQYLADDVNEMQADLNRILDKLNDEWQEAYLCRDLTDAEAAQAAKNSQKISALLDRKDPMLDRDLKPAEIEQLLRNHQKLRSAEAAQSAEVIMHDTIGGAVAALQQFAKKQSIPQERNHKSEPENAVAG